MQSAKQVCFLSPLRSCAFQCASRCDLVEIGLRRRSAQLQFIIPINELVAKIWSAAKLSV